MRIKEKYWHIVPAVATEISFSSVAEIHPFRVILLLLFYNFIEHNFLDYTNIDP